MRVWQRIRRPELLQQLAAAASSVHIRLALTSDSAESTKWIVRSLVVDVFPRRWLNGADSPISEASPSHEYDPPWFVHDYPGHALFFAGFVPSRLVDDWLTHPEECRFTQFDERPGQSLRVVTFSIPGWHEDVPGNRVYSGKPDGFAKLPWPRNVYKFSLKDSNLYHAGDQATLYAMGQPHFDNLREARAKLIYDYHTGLESYVDEDKIAVRFIDGEGWISFARFTDTRVELRVGGLNIHPGRLILKGDGLADIEKSLMGPGIVIFDLSAPPPPNLNVVLANQVEELDRAWRSAWPSPFDPPAAHVMDEVTSDGQSPPPEADPSPESVAAANAAPATTMEQSTSPHVYQQPMQEGEVRTTVPLHAPVPSAPGFVRKLRVIVASPSDTQDERIAVRRVLDELNHGLADVFRLRLEPWMWESDSYPGLHTEGPQGQVDESMAIDKSDIVIGIFWKRFGKPVADAKSGTEHELRRAIDSSRQSGHPHVMIYFNEQQFFPRSKDERAQFASVADFRDEVQEIALICPYVGSDQFELLLRQHLQHLLREHYDPQAAARSTQQPERLVLQNTTPSGQPESLPPTQLILRYLVLHHKPEETDTADAVRQVTGLEERDLKDTLHELGDAGAIKNLTMSGPHRYNNFQVLVTAWAQVAPEVLGFNLDDDKFNVAAVAAEHDQLDRDELLRSTGLPEHRLDIAALLLETEGVFNLFKPSVRGLAFRSVWSNHKTRAYVRDHRKP